MENKAIIKEFIEQVWNQGKLEHLGNFIHKDFQDQALPKGFANGAAGLKQWIESVSSSFEHQTTIESIVEEDEMVFVRIRFSVTHVGAWRGILPSRKNASVKGFRQFRISGGKIIEHWALLDGDAIQNSLTEETKGCSINV